MRSWNKTLDERKHEKEGKPIFQRPSWMWTGQRMPIFCKGDIKYLKFKTKQKKMLTTNWTRWPSLFHRCSQIRRFLELHDWLTSFTWKWSECSWLDQWPENVQESPPSRAEERAGKGGEKAGGELGGVVRADQYNKYGCGAGDGWVWEHQLQQQQQQQTAFLSSCGC